MTLATPNVFFQTFFVRDNNRITQKGEKRFYSYLFVIFLCLYHFVRLFNSYLFHFEDMSTVYDIIVIGGGIVGLGVFRQLTLNGYKNVLLVEKSSQIITGASSGNSGILHTGFDTVPQTLESKLVKRGYELYQSFARDIELPIKKIGAYIIAWKPEDLEILREILDTAHEVIESFILFIK